MFILGLKYTVSEMTLNIEVPRQKLIDKSEVEKIILDNFKQIAIDWGRHQTAYIFDVYRTFRDHDKFLIVIYLLKKTFDEYKINSINISYNEFYCI